MPKQRGMPKGLDLLGARPKPVRSGDYLDEVLAPTATPRQVSEALQPVVASPVEPEGRQKRPPETVVGEGSGDAPSTTAPAKEEESRPRRKTKDIHRARLNVSDDGMDRLREVVSYIESYGPEPTIKASEVIEAAISIVHEARGRLDLSKMRRRGKYGTTSHQVYSAALAESIKRAVANLDGPTGI